jgi:hypothetical protein
MPYLHVIRVRYFFRVLSFLPAGGVVDGVFFNLSGQNGGHTYTFHILAQAGFLGELRDISCVLDRNQV